MVQLPVDTADMANAIGQPSGSVLTDSMQMPGISDTATVTGPESLFGDSSYIPAAYDTAETFNFCASLTDGIVVKLTVMACLAGYILLLYYYRGYFHALARTVVSKLYDDIHFEEQNRVFAAFINTATLLGMASMALCIVRLMDIWGWQPYYGGYALPANLIVPAIIVMLLCISLYQRIVLRAAGSIALALPLTDRLQHIRKRMYSLFFLVLTPLSLMFVYSNGTAATVFAILISTAAASFVIMLCYKSLGLFRQQKVSISDWILYLCAVEIFPVSFFVLAVLRNT